MPRDRTFQVAHRIRERSVIVASPSAMASSAAFATSEDAASSEDALLSGVTFPWLEQHHRRRCVGFGSSCRPRTNLHLHSSVPLQALSFVAVSRTIFGSTIRSNLELLGRATSFGHSRVA